MREMKDSGIAWIGEIPREWGITRVKSYFSHHKIIAGENADNYERLALTLNGVIRRSKDDNEGLQPEEFRGYQILDENELVFKLIDLANVKTSRVGLSPYLGIVSPAYIILHNDRKDNKFFYWWFMFMYYNEIFNQLGDNGVRSALNAKDLLCLPIVNIDERKQHLISSYLDAKCSEIDRALSLQEQMISELRAYKQSLITETVTHGLNPNAKMKNSGVEWIGEIPEGWEVKRVKNVLAECNEYTQTGKEEQLSVTQAKGIIRSKDANIANPTNSTVGWRIVHRNNIVFNKYKAHSGVFFVSPYEGIVTFNYCVYECFNKDYPKYYEYLFKTPCCIGEFRKLMRGVGESISPLYTKDLFAIFIPCPPIKDQHAIASFLDEKCAEIDALIVLREKKMEALKEYKKSLIYECVTGKKQVI